MVDISSLCRFGLGGVCFVLAALLFYFLLHFLGCIAAEAPIYKFKFVFLEKRNKL